jgi:YVTN family beta-propeller protein
MRVALFTAILGLGLAAAVLAERAWVTNRGSSSVTVYDTVTHAVETTVTVGSGPVDIASDQTDGFGPTRLFVANAGSDSVSVIGADPVSVGATVTGGGAFGAFDVPMGVARVQSGFMNPSIAVVDQKVTTFTDYSGTSSGRGTIRFLHPQTLGVVDNFREASFTARYNDVVFTQNGRLWVADGGDKGVTVVRLPNGGPPFFLTETLIYQGSGEFADFIYDPASPPTFMVSPARLATNGTTRVVVADGGSDVVTILDANYVPDAEGTAVLSNITLGTGGTCADVEVVGNFAYVTTTAGASNLHRIDLTTLAVSSIAAGAGREGLGATFDGTKLYAGGGPIDASIQEVDLSTFVPAGVPFVSGGSNPFGFYISPKSSAGSGGPGGGGGTTWVSTSTGGDGGAGPSCGCLGLEILVALFAARLIRKCIGRLR